MTLILVFALVLLAAVLVSDLARRSVLSTAVLFLAAGFVVGEGVLDLVRVDPGDPVVKGLAMLALFSVLFTDGMRVGVRDLASAWRLPGRALLLGLPLTLLGTAVLARLLTDLAWIPALLLGAVLSPTDPVFVAAIVGRKEVPLRLRQLLNVESGVNDGLVLPVVLVLLALLSGRPAGTPRLLGELALGVAIGVALPWIYLKVERLRVFGASGTYEPLSAFAVGLAALALAHITHANEFLAAFAAGVTVATVSPVAREAFAAFGEVLTELLKLAALLVFGALISPAFLAELSAGGYAFALLTLVLVRPAAITLALLDSGLARRERLAAAWFGPKGFAAVVYAILVLERGLPESDQIFHLAAVAVAASIVLHSSTDVLLVRHVVDPEPGGSREPSAEDRTQE